MRFISLLSLFLLYWSITVLSQPDIYSIKHYDTETGLPQNSIKSAEMDCDGFIWFATEMGLVRFDGTHFKYFNQQNSKALKESRIIGLHIDDSCKVKFRAGEHCYRISDMGVVEEYIADKAEISDTLHSKKFHNQPLLSSITNNNAPGWAEPNHELSSRSLHNSFTYLNGHYYYFNQMMEIISFDTRRKLFEKYKITGKLKTALLHTKNEPNSVSILKQDGDFFIRLGTMIYKIVVSEADKTIASEPFLEVDSIPNITYLRIWDKYKLVLVGTMGEGFYLFSKKQFFTRLLPDWESNIFYAQASFGDSGVITKKAVLLPNANFTFPSYTSESLLLTTKGEYYANKYKSVDDAGIVEFGKDLKERKYLKAYDLKVNCFQELKNGGVWFTSNKPFFGKIADNKIQWVSYPPGFPDNLEIKTFIETSANEFLVAGTFGLYKIDLSKNIAVEVAALKNKNVRCLYTDKLGSIFIGTYGNGYYVLNNDRIVELPQDKNGYMNSVHAFIEDKAGYIWMSTNRGLFQALVKDVYDFMFGFRDNLYYQYYDKNDGLLSNEFNGGCSPSVIRLNNGMVSFPSIKGLVQFIPEQIQPQLPESEIFIEEVTVDGSMIKKTKGVFSISNQAKLVEISVASPYYGNTYNQQIHYKIEGLDNKWAALDKSGKIKFNRLAAGKYKLLLSKQRSFGRTNLASNEIIFDMQPLFYEKWTFKIILLLAFSILLLLIFALRLVILRRLKNKLQEDIKKRIKTQEALINELGLTVRALEKSKAEVEISNSLKERLAMIIAHDLQSPLRFLSQVTQNLHTKAVSGDTPEVIAMSTEIQKSLVNIHQFVEEFGLCLKSHQSNFQVRKRKFELSELLNELNLFFADQVKAKGNRLSIEISDEIFIYSDRQLLKIILRNLIDNANKNTRNGIINISIESDDEYLNLIISDNGTGMENALVSKLNRQLKEVDFVPLLNLVNKGYGYQFIGMFSKVLGLYTEIKSKPGNGTEIRIMNMALYEKINSSSSFTYPIIMY